ncbi:hypothetical protein [Actinomyces vulturis]|uniref:hypothetical protein n=1 Tax=Actinomyces vulturis TaxID=1857645 RepID=UPI00159EBB02|nr:hypothetical protein [Actinomyces vulturis]
MIVLGIWIAGGWHNGAEISSYATGALVGAIGGAFFIPWFTKRQHAKDEKRLSVDAE